ncbi:MAG: TonB-dependent receptor plug domain-containing protein [Deferrisomatales bacterium]
MKLLFPAAALLLAAPLASAAEPATLAPVVVTATRTPRPVAEVGSSVTVITAERLAASGARSLAEVLGDTVGLEAVSNGTRGSIGSLSLRGSEPQQVLVLLDGVRLNSPQNGQFNLSDLPVPLAEIDRIEVLRGPGSALYGPGALGGVVQIFTRRPEAEPLTRVSWTEGRHDTRAASFSTSRKAGAVGYRLSAGKDRSLGYRPNSDLDQTALDGSLLVDLPAGAALELAARHLEKETGVPGSRAFPSPAARQDDRHTVAAARLTGSAAGAGLRLAGQYARFDNRYEDPAGWVPLDDRHVAESASTEAQADWRLGAHALTAAGELGRDFLDSTASGERDQGRWALLAQDEVALGGRVTLVAGLRYDAHSDFRNEWSPRASLAVRAAEATRLRASVGRAYRPPTFNDRFWPFDGFAQGNPGLDPETAWEYEVGVTQGLGERATVSLTGFRRDARDLIDWQPVDPADPFGVWSPVNVAQSRTWGAEASADASLTRAVGVGAGYTYLHPVDRETREFLPGKPRHQLGAHLELRPVADTRLRLAGRYARYYPEAGRGESSHTVFDATLTRALYVGDQVALDATLGVKNLFDRSYEMNAGFPMPPREWQLGLTATF